MDNENILLFGRGLLALASFIAFFAVGRAVSRRAVSPEAQLAKRGFELWWYGLAGLTLFTPLFWLLDWLQVTDLMFLLTTIQALLILIIAAFAGLAYYLLYLYSGQRRLLYVVLVYFSVLLAWLEALIDVAHPIGWGAPTPGAAKTILYEHALTGNPASVWLGILLFLPLLGSAIAYTLLLFKADGRTPKYRIGMVGGAFTVWFTISLAGTISGLANKYPNGWQLASSAIGLVASLVILAAYKPPRWVANKFRLETTPR